MARKAVEIAVGRVAANMRPKTEVGSLSKKVHRRLSKAKQMAEHVKKLKPLAEDLTEESSSTTRAKVVKDDRNAIKMADQGTQTDGSKNLMNADSHAETRRSRDGESGNHVMTESGTQTTPSLNALTIQVADSIILRVEDYI